MLGIQPVQSAMKINRFAFVVHPLSIKDIHAHPSYRFTRFLPAALVEKSAALMPPVCLSRITGIQSPTTGQRAEGYLYALFATPRQMLAHAPEFTYKRVEKIARLAHAKGAGILGLGAFTSVVGDAGVTIASESPIAVTSGNSLTAAAAIEAARAGARKMSLGEFDQCRIMVVGATGSIGSACARLLAEETNFLVLVSRSDEKLAALKQRIHQQNPTVNIETTTNAGDFLPACDVIISATSAFGQRVLDVSQCKPGAVVCDVARPHDINEAEAALRPDILVIDSGEIKLPGEVDIGYNIGLEPGIVFACMAETILLTLEGRYENYTVGRNLDTQKAKELLQLFHKHLFQLAPLRSFDRAISDDDIAHKRAKADSMLTNEQIKQRIISEAAKQISHLPPMAKGVG